MMRIITVLKNAFKKSDLKTPLGRWNVEICNKKINTKIDLANEDHCGPCGKYINNKIANNKLIDKK
jgi:hypothetical protein